MDADDAQIPSPPPLVAPVDATAVDGNEVTFVWESVEGAETYRLQVARSARFNEMILNTEVGDETAVTVGNQFSADGETYFWRVQAGSGEQWSDGGTVESFLAVSEAEAKAVLLAGEEEEEPVTALARAAREEATAQTFDLEDRFEKEKERGVAYEGVATSEIMGFALAIVVAILAAVAILFGWFEQVRQEARETAIQTQDYEQVRQAEIEATERLQNYGVVDEDAGVYRIPIDQAMDLIATEEYQQPQEQQSSSP